ncbi:2-polyprenyl-3-methyl-5-hydroxy-6-metoxy-1,4-benzoquinol methylase [Ekhidna lutea]|uniref:2-polyprenyl-3-methyl-5-hydroxy-6-metoxy-1,4-benzoquinol methylase n=1 Tax=Ekhidna lutea TaxID=447679 RepID=A0A239EQX2_EKHLU|nr:class I SAM-dependent methyltransferase [Ekhidna lutea]SNS46322.1 2-polyprenyl-3-methyl-5-hydroxy-6-metoxy-1,4-benzoquinol methylase [Ekhidna lutea]
MYEKLDNCPICNHTQFQNQIICDDHSVSGESFALVKCSNCSLVFTNPRPDEESLPKYYQSDAYISHTDRANSLINIIYKVVRKITLRKKVHLINKINTQSGQLLDYGCGTGDFIQTATENNWQAFGYEPDEKARVIAKSKNGTSVIEKLSEVNDQVDIITAWHVIEHVSDLKETIKSLKKKLKEGGHMILAVPNYQSFDAQHYQEFWAAYDVPRHLYHFDQVSMKALATQTKLKLVETIPMLFDSYYVSLLSEKYKPKGSLLNALRIGQLSNKKAAKTNQYSSLIYILRK